MPNYMPHYLLQYGGPLRVGEIWSQNIRFIASQEFTSEDQDDAAATAKTVIQTWGAASGSGWSNDASLSYVKFNRIKENGRYFDEGATHRVDFTPVPMGAAASPLPNQIALVLSWVTDFTRGLAHAGRVYVPAPLTGIQPSGRISATSCMLHANQAAAFLNSINAALSGIPGLEADVEASVVSGVEPVKARITRVRVGDVLDTQQRRRNNLQEVYSLSTTLVTDL